MGELALDIGLVGRNENDNDSHYHGNMLIIILLPGDVPWQALVWYDAEPRNMGSVCLHRHPP